MAKKKATRKRALDEDKRREIIAVVSLGASRENAAKYVGCVPETIRNEMKRDPEFAGEIRKAEENPEIYFLQKIRAAANKEQYWRAAAWALERRCPNRYAARGARTLSEEQVLKLISDIVEIVVPEIQNLAERRSIFGKINRLIHTLDLPENEIRLYHTEDEEKE